jgi:ABC-type transport system substrate-binding protein
VYALLNNDSDILSDRAVRRALQRATNIEEIRKKVGGDVPALSLPYTDLFMEEEVAPKVPAYDQKEAGKLLDDAGWKLEGGVRKKDGKELRITVVTAKSVDYERALETLIGQWRRVGVRVSERIIDAADPTQNFVQSVLQQRSYDVLLYQLTMGGDPDVFAYWHSSQAVARGLNLANYSSAISDDILSSARSSKRDDLRDAKHIAFARQWIEDAPAIGLYQSVTRTAVSHNVHGMSKDVVLVGPAQRYTQAPQWMVGDRTVYKTP